jgi:hypothetical protein
VAVQQAQQLSEVVGVGRRARPQRRVSDDPEGAEDVVRVFGTLLGNDPFEDDLLSLLDLELGALDEVGSASAAAGSSRFQV